MHRLLSLVILILFVGINPSTAAGAGGAVADSIMAKISIFQTDIELLNAQMPGLSGEDSLIIHHELNYAQLQALDQIYLLTLVLNKSNY